MMSDTGNNLADMARKAVTSTANEIGGYADIVRKAQAMQRTQAAYGWPRSQWARIPDESAVPGQSLGKGQLSQNRVTNKPTGGSEVAGASGGGATRGRQKQSEDFYVSIRDDNDVERKVQCRVVGPKDGLPIIQNHGTPGSRTDTAEKKLLWDLGVRLYTFDRPGYGRSERYAGAKHTDGGKIAVAIADRYGHDKFAVVGRSGGTPWAAAMAACLPERVTRLGLLVPLAPQELMGKKFFEGMVNQSGLDKPYDRLTEERVNEFLEGKSLGSITGTPENVLPDRDKEILQTLRPHIEEMYTEGVKNGPGGWTDDLNRAMPKQWVPPPAWGYRIDEIKSPTLIWSASADGHNPSAHAEALAAALPPEQCRLYVVPGGEVGHFGAMMIKPSVYAWLLGKEDLLRFPVNPPPGHPPGAPIPTTFEQWTSLAEPGNG